MSAKKMDALQTSSYENDLKPVLKSNECAPTHFRNNFHSVRILEDLKSLRKNEVLCDIRFETDDGCITFGHKNVLMAASPYFQAMFNKFDESNKDLINIRELDSAVLQILVDYIYTGECIVTTDNVQDLLPAANILQLDFVSAACSEFLQKQLDASNCLGIRAFADLHNCADLFSSSEAFIKKQFLEVVKSDKFLSSSFEDVVKLISCNDIAVPFEEKVFDCVIKWVEHDLNHRKDCLPELMEHVRLPLLNPDILFNIISKEPLLKNSPKCKDYVFDALQFNLQKSIQYIAIPKTIRCKPRQFGGLQKVILMFSRSNTLLKCFTQWYDPTTRLLKNAPGINYCCQTAGLGVIQDQFVVVAGGVNGSSSQSVYMLDVSSQSPSWYHMVDMLNSRKQLGVGVLDDCMYAVGGLDGITTLNSVEVFDVSFQKWRMVSSMSIKRYNLGIGVLNNRLYAVGGCNNNVLKSVEYYDPALDTWTPVAEMSVCREGAGVGVLNGLMYAIGGQDEEYLRSVEVYRPSDGVWSFTADMLFPRFKPGVAVLDGLLYVIGGESDESIDNTVEIYNPLTNNWAVEILSKHRYYGGVVVNRPPPHHE